MDLSWPALEATRRRLLARFGVRVEPWWERLPGAIADLAARWELVIGEAVGRGNTSVVVRCRRLDGRPAVLKLTPDAKLGGAEASALRRWESSGRVPVVWGHDAALGALLLEAIPNETSVAADAADQVLLHGDLHPGNVLDGGAERGLVAIDPRPCAGDAAVDAVDWAFWAADAPGAWEARSRDLALALGLDHERLWAWCAAFAAMLATARAAHGASADRVAALLALSPWSASSSAAPARMPSWT